MKRVVTALMLTAAGLVVLLQYRVPPLPPVKPIVALPKATVRVQAAAPPRPKAAPKPSASPKPTPNPTPIPSRFVAVAPVVHRTPPPTPRPSPARTPTPAVRTFTGTPFPACNYGDVEVQITVQGNRITDAQAPQYPTDRQQSRDINQSAIPQLDQETVQTQSANIDTVSGATCTSDGYKQSLQAAIDQWKPGG